MSRVRPDRCQDPGPRDTHCTEHPGHRYSCYDAGEDVSWNEPTWRDDGGPAHQCDDAACPDNGLVAGEVR